MIDEEQLSGIINSIVDNRRIFSAVMCVEKGDATFSWIGAAGEIEKEDKFFIASVTKLFVTAVILRLIEDKQLALADNISTYLPKNIWQRIHVYKGVDYSKKITVGHLLSNTSGLPDYFFYRQASGERVSDELTAGKDNVWDLDRTVDLVKQLRPKFPPGAGGKAAYSDTNYQLLGRIIEIVTGKVIGEVFDEFIFSQLALRNTYVYQDINDSSPVPFYHQSQRLWLPNYMTSVTAEGGIVSTAKELMTFLKAFFDGRFFPKGKIQQLKQWKLLWPPPGLFYYGVGLEKLWTPRILSPIKPFGEIIGFWGQTGSFAFFHPKTDLYFTGTTNQINGQGHMAAGKAMFRVIKSVM